jgi:uncharacterized protein (DUF58 family)
MQGSILQNSMSLPSPYFQVGALARLEGLRFGTRRRIEGSLSGRHIARKQGGSGEFANYREYTPGDDLRRLDWRVMGRTGRAYLKLYQDETNLACTILIDASGSMGFNGYPGRKTDSKLQWCQYFATALSHLILVGRDHVGLAVARHGLVNYLPPTCLPQQRGAMHEAIAMLKPQDQTELAPALDGVFLQVKRRGVLMVLSDFLVPDIEPTLASLRKFRQRGWEVIAMHVQHPDESHLPTGRAFRFTGMEWEQPVSVEVSELRKLYEQRVERHREMVRSGMLGVGCDFLSIQTSVSYLDVLRSFLIARNG